MPKTASERMQDYRANLRRQGLKPVQMWVFDTKAPGFKEEMTRQLKIVAQSEDERDVMRWIEEAGRGLWEEE
jgi:DNA-binding LacI/PurR family transcriptional regulator